MVNDKNSFCSEGLVARIRVLDEAQAKSVLYFLCGWMRKVGDVEGLEIALSYEEKVQQRYEEIKARQKGQNE
jgi:hypothetical protein